MHEVLLRRYFNGLFLNELLCPGAFSGFMAPGADSFPPEDRAPKLLTARDAAEVLAVCEKTLWTLTDRGEIPVVRVGRAVRYDPRDLSAWIAKNKSFGSAGGSDNQV